MATTTKNATAKKTTPAKATAKQKATAKKPTPKPKAPGVAAKVTRPYLAGQIIKKHGLAAGVTDAMVAELDAAYGRANPTESRYRLSEAWHVARGYSGLAGDAVS